MPNKYVNFISDDHFLSCIDHLYKSYIKANKDIDKPKLYSNKIDIIKLSTDTLFGKISEEELIRKEIERQVDKSISNAIGTFHEEILGGISGFEKGTLSGYDIKANDNTLFADIKNKHNTMNSSASEALFQKLTKFADANPTAKCYWVQILATGSFNKLWDATLNGTRYSHPRIYAISGDKFYELLSAEKNALYNLYKALPIAINDYFIENKIIAPVGNQSTAFVDITQFAAKNSRTALAQIAKDNFGYYNGFDSL